MLRRDSKRHVHSVDKRELKTMTNDAPMSREKLHEILKEHHEWFVSGGQRGKQADLRGANLQKADLQVVKFLDNR